jgi:hypothetical protein
VDEQALGIARAVEQGRELPLARGTSIGVLGRAQVLESPDGPPIRDSGDLRRVERIASSSDRRAEATARDAALRAAGRRLGRALARRILGEPEPEWEAL